MIENSLEVDLDHESTYFISDDESDDNSRLSAIKEISEGCLENLFEDGGIPQLKNNTSSNEIPEFKNKMDDGFFKTILCFAKGAFKKPINDNSLRRNSEEKEISGKPCDTIKKPKEKWRNSTEKQPLISSFFKKN